MEVWLLHLFPAQSRFGREIFHSDHEWPVISCFAERWKNSGLLILLGRVCCLIWPFSEILISKSYQLTDVWQLPCEMSLIGLSPVARYHVTETTGTSGISLLSLASQFSFSRGQVLNGSWKLNFPLDFPQDWGQVHCESGVERWSL